MGIPTPPRKLKKASRRPNTITEMKGGGIDSQTLLIILWIMIITVVILYK